MRICLPEETFSFALIAFFPIEHAARPGFHRFFVGSGLEGRTRVRSNILRTFPLPHGRLPAGPAAVPHDFCLQSAVYLAGKSPFARLRPYGMFRLDMSKRLDIDAVRATA